MLHSSESSTQPVDEKTIRKGRIFALIKEVYSDRFIGTKHANDAHTLTQILNVIRNLDPNEAIPEGLRETPVNLICKLEDGTIFESVTPYEVPQEQEYFLEDLERFMEDAKNYTTPLNNGSLTEADALTAVDSISEYISALDIMPMIEKLESIEELRDGFTHLKNLDAEGRIAHEDYINVWNVYQNRTFEVLNNQMKTISSVSEKNAFLALASLLRDEALLSVLKHHKIESALTLH